MCILIFGKKVTLYVENVREYSKRKRFVCELNTLRERSKSEFEKVFFRTRYFYRKKHFVKPGARFAIFCRGTGIFNLSALFSI